MDAENNLFSWKEVNLTYFYIFLFLSALIAYYLTKKSNSKYKIELFFISFYILSGSLNEILTLKIPGFSLFEIQPTRFIFLMLVFFLFRKVYYSKENIFLTIKGKVPWWELMLYAYFIFYILSQFANISSLGLSKILVNISGELIFLVVFLALRLMSNDDSYNIIFKSILIGAVLSSLIGIAQIIVDPFFLRIGSDRLAFGDVYRANGIFWQEHYNSYFLIIAIALTLLMLKKNSYKFILISLFSIGVVISFHRMSWLIFVALLAISLVFVEKMAIDKLILLGLSGMAVLLVIFILYNYQIMNTALVKERLTDTVSHRKGYYAMVLDNIHQKPVFGFGGRNNEAYYSYMLKITRRIGRATGDEGGIHSGYFSAMFYSGIPAFLSYTLFIVFSVFYFAKLFTRNNLFAIPFFMAFIFLIGNLTNTLEFSSHVGIFYAMLLGISMGVKRKMDLSELES